MKNIILIKFRIEFRREFIIVFILFNLFLFYTFLINFNISQNAVLGHFKLYKV